MPLLLPPPPPARRGGSSRRLNRIRRRRLSRKRHWADLPLDALLHIFHRLDHVDLMFGGASRVRRSWRDAAREPELWRRIDLCGHSWLFRETISLNRMARLAIWFSDGQCMEFVGDDNYLDDDLICFLADQAPLLKTLCLAEFYINIDVFADAIKKWPLLETLELCVCYGDTRHAIEFVATNCPQLKHFKLVKGGGYPDENSEALAIARMHGLCSLQIFDATFDNKVLTIILDNCPHLELLYLVRCYNVIVDTSLQAKCARIKTKKICPYFSEYSSSPLYPGHNERDCDFLYAEGHDSEDSDHYSCSYTHAEEADFGEHEKSLDKGTCRRRHRHLRI